MDDFGTGYSSLSYLHNFPVDVIKIDRSFISHMSQSHKNEELVRTIFNLAANLGMQVIAEGVETDEQLEIIRSMGCRYVQGFYYCKPLGKVAATAYLKKMIDGGDANKIRLETENKKQSAAT